jgi:hypothetical protein
MLTANRKPAYAFRLIYGALLLALLWAVLRCLAACPVHAETLDTILNHIKISNPEPIRQAFNEENATAKVIVYYQRPSSLSGSEPLDTDQRRKTVRDKIRTARDGFVKETTTEVGGGFVSDFSGTSAACPYAAGMAAVMQGAAMEATESVLTPTQVKARLTDYGNDITYSSAGITKPRPNLYATDIDDDGMPAGWEVDYFDSIERNGTDDYDGDGLVDLDEYEAGTLPDDADSDDDGMTDGDEIENATDPLDEDSDDDGYSDGEELDAGILWMRTTTPKSPPCRPLAQSVCWRPWLPCWVL